ncbi:MAG: hypothetical protein FGM14_10470 [Flavobacteriales bacterium]|nr:hypothetical protein [Flavobacteriales bacterium]
MRQGSSATSSNKSTISPGENVILYVNWNFDTGGKSVYIVYTTNGTNPSKTNGTSVACSFSNFLNPNRTWVGTIPSSAITAGTQIKYVFYISDGNLAAAWGRVASSSDASGYTTTWTESDAAYSFTVVSQFYSKSTGNLDVLTNWGSNTDGTGVAPANFTSNNVTYNIRNNAAPTIGAAWTVSGTGSKIIVGDGTNACTLTLPSGTAIYNSVATDVSNNATVKFQNATAPTFGTTQFLSGSIYEHNLGASGGTIPTATWNSNSTCRLKYTANTSSSPSGLNQTFGKFEIDLAAGQTNNNLIITPTNVTNEFRVTSTGGGSIELQALVIDGNYVQTGGTAKIRAATGASSANVKGSFTLSGGSFMITDANGSGNQSQITVDGDCSLNGGTFSFLNTSGTSGVAFMIIRGGTTTIGSGVTFSGFLLTTSGFYFNRLTAGTMNVNIAQPFSSGSIRNAFYYNTTNTTGINETYNGSSAQTTVNGTNATPGTGFAAWPTTGTVLKTLTISNTAGVTASTAKVINTSLVVDASCRYDIGANNHTIASGATGTINGTLRSAATITTTGTLTFSSTGTYEHNFTTTAGTIPTATWSSTSNCNIIGYTTNTAAASGLNQTFGNFTWNCTGQTSSTNLNGGLNGSVSGNFNVISTGTAQLRLGGSSSTWTSTISGALNIQGGTLAIIGSGTAGSGAATINVNGDLTISGGILDFNAVSNAASSTINIGGNFSQTGGAIQRSFNAVSTFVFNKSSGTQTFTQSAGTISNNINWNVGNGTSTNTVQLGSNVNLGTGTGTFTVANNASMDFGTFTLSGSGTFAASTGSTLISANTNATGAFNTSGANGSVLTTTRTFSNAGVNYTFNGASAQNTGNAIGSATNTNIKNLTLNNSSGVTLSASALLSSTGTLTLTSGSLTLGANDLTLTSGATISGANSSKFIKTSSTGQLKQTVGGSSVTFPVGNAAYNPISFSNSGTSDTYGVRVVDGALASTYVPNAVTKTINRRWEITEAVTGGGTITPALTFNLSERNDATAFNSASNPYVGLFTSSWSQVGATSSGTDPLTFTSGSSFSPSTSPYSFGCGKDDGLAAIACTPPSTQATIGAYTNNTAGTSVTVNWTRGNGTAGVIVVARATATAAVNPTSGTTYTANAAFGSGNTTGTNNFVVYSGTGTSVNVTGLTAATGYTFTVFEYNTTGTCYLTPGSSSAVTTCNPATANAGSPLDAICRSGISAQMGGSVGGGATGGTWSGGAGTWSNASNPSTATYTASASESGSITLTLTTTGGCATVTATKNITVNSLPSAPTGTNGSGCGTGTVSISASVGAGETVDWYAASSGGSVLSGGSATTSFTTPSISSTTIYYAEARNTTTNCVSSTRTAVTATVNSLPAISTQPSAPTATCSGSGTQTISVTATGTGLTYSWRKGGVALSNGGVISGQGTATLTLTSPTTSDAGSYDVVVSGTCSPSVTSTAVTVTVNSSVGGTASATPSSVCLNGSTSVSLSGNSGSTFQWQRSEDAGSTWSNISGATSSSYTTPNLITATSYRATVTNGSCTSATSSTVAVSINETNTSSASSATYNSAWSNSQNDNTTGLGAWSLSTTGTAGFFTGSSDVNNGGTRSWGMFASGGSNLASAVRTVSMSIGNTLSFSMDNGSIDNSKTIGFALQNASGENLMELLFIGGQSFYQIIDAAGTTNTSIGYTSGGLDVSVAYTAGNTYAIYVTGKGGATESYTARTFSSQGGGQVPTQIRFFNAGAGSGPSYDLFFNSLSISNPIISSHPSSSAQNVCQNGSATALSVTASGTSLAYQWYSNTTASNSGGTLINLATSSSYTPSSATAGTLYYYCVVTNGSCGSATSRVSGAVTVVSSTTSISPSSTQNISISTNGTQLSVSTGTATVSSRAWKYSTTSGSGYTAFSPAQTGTTYTPNFASSGTYYVVCEVTYSSPCGVVTSNEVQVTVAANSITTSSISGSPFCAGATGVSVPFTYSGAGSFPSATFKAQLSNSSGSFASPVDLQTVASDGSGSQSITVTIPSNSAEGTGYRIRVVSDNPALSGTDNGTNLTINATSVGGSISGGTTVCTGTNSTNLTLSGHTGSVTKWQSSTTSDFSASVSDITNTTTSLTATNLSSTTYYRAVVTNGACSAANSSSATISVSSASVGGTVSGGSAICLGSTSASLSLSGHTGSITKWQSAPAPYTTWTDVSNTSSSYTSGALSQSTQFRAVVTNGVCPAANSAATTVTVDQSNADASTYNTSWSNGSSDGATGLNSWSLSTTGTAGHFIGTSDIDVNTESWGMYANSSGEANGIRPFTSNLSTGSSLNFSIDNGSVQSGGVVGFSLRNSSSQNLMEFYLTGGSSFYTINDNAGPSLTSVPNTTTGLRISISYTGANTYSISITPASGGNTTYFTGRTFSTTGTSNQVPREIRFFNYNAGSGSQYDYFINSISLNRPSIGSETNFAAQNLCQNSTASSLSVAAYGTGLSYQWYQNTSASTSGATAITNATSSSYTPSTTTAGTLYYYCIVSGTCSSVRSNFSGAVTVTAAPTTANAGADQTGSATCGLTSVTLAGNSALSGTGAWSIISGTGGSITTPSSATSAFSGTAGSTYTLRWTISNTNCTSSTDDVVITFNQNPTASNAGADQTGLATCGLTSVTLAGNSATTGSGAWSIISGTGGSITTPSSATSAFSGVAGSTYTLRWTISNSPCTASTDDVVIAFNQNPTTANAGPDQSVCSGATVTLAATSASAGSGAWSIISGSGGTVTTPASATSTFTGTAGTSYTLRWTTTNSPCTASTDDVVITFNSAVSYGTVSNAPNTNDHLVISQVYGGGGNSGATYTNDFVEIFNPTSSTVSLTNWKIQYASSAGSYADAATLSGSINPGKYYLISLAGGATGASLPSADATGLTNLSATTGKVRLINASSVVIDKLGYGTSSSPDPEGTAVAAASGNAVSYQRANNGCTDTDNNSNDFSNNVTANARNSSSPTNDCSGIVETDCSGDIPSAMSVSGASGSSLFTYQWYSISGQQSAPTGNSTSGWTSLGSTDGANTATYTPTSGISSTTTYACFVTPTGTPSCGTGTWAGSCRQVLINSVTGGTVAGSTSVCSGGNPAAFTQSVASTGSGTLTYQWESSASSDFSTTITTIAGATSTTYDVPAGITATTYYRRKVTSILNGKSCSAYSNVLTVTVNALPTITGTTTVCVNATTQLTGSGTPAASNPWVVASNPTKASVNSSGLVTGLISGTPSPTVTYTDNNGCTSTASTITVNALPTVSFTTSPAATLCSATSATYTTQASQSNYIWSVPGTLNTDYTIASGGIGTSSNTVTINWLTSGSKTVTVNYTNANGCTAASAASNSTTVTISPTTSNAGSSQTLCSGIAATLAANSPSVGSGAWTVTGGPNTSTSQFSSTSSATATFTPAGGSGSYVLRWTTSNGSCTSTSDVTITVNSAAPSTTGVSICQDASSASMSVTSDFANAGTTFSGTWASTPTAIRPTSSISNDAICSFTNGNSRNYTITQFQVSVSGNYTFEMDDNSNYDGMAYLTSGNFTPGSCSTGTWIVGDDDGGVNNEPRFTASLSTGVIYTLYSTTYSSSAGTYLGSFSWTVTPPSGGNIMTPVNWYTASSGGTLLGTGTSFNPVGVANSGLANTATAGTTTYYAAFSNNTTCRTATNYEIKAKPSAPTIGTITQPTCGTATASVALSGLPSSGSWTVAGTPSGSLASSGTTGTVTGLTANQTYTFTVTNADGCTSSASGNAVVNAQPATPSAPTASAQSLCSGSDVSNLSASGTAIQWYTAATGGSALSTSEALSTGTYYASQTVSGCESVTRTSVAVTVNPTGTWIGDSNDDWNDAANWCGGVPNSSSAVVSIPSGVTVNMDASPTVLNLTIGSGATLVANGQTITVASGGSFTNNGTYSVGTGAANLVFSGNGTIGGTGTTVTLNNLTINGTLTVSTSPTVNGIVTINSDGSIATNPIIYGTSSTLVYNQGGEVSVTSNEWPTSNSPRNVTVQNNSNLTLNGSKTIIGTLTMGGDIITGANTITIGNSSATPGTLTYNSGKIMGELRRYFANTTGTNYSFPVGNTTYKRGVTINFTDAPGENQYLTVAYRSGVPILEGQTEPLYTGLPFTTADGQLIQNYSDEGYWEINPTAYGSGIDTKTYQITLEMNNIGGVNDFTKTRLIRAKGPSHLSWEALTHISSTGDNSNYSITASGSGFSWFAGGGDDNNNPLPVELLYFNGECTEQGNILRWATASEFNSSHYDVEASQDGENWNVINTQAAAGFSTELQTYTYVDFEKSNAAYYRLNQVDINGDNKIYNPIFINCDGTSTQLSTYPNPSKGGFNVAVSDSKFVGESSLIIRDAMGKEVLRKLITVEEGVNLFPIEADEIENGVYFISIENSNVDIRTIKHVKN